MLDTTPAHPALSRKCFPIGVVSPGNQGRSASGGDALSLGGKLLFGEARQLSMRKFTALV